MAELRRRGGGRPEKGVVSLSCLDATKSSSGRFFVPRFKICLVVVVCNSLKSELDGVVTLYLCMKYSSIFGHYLKLQCYGYKQVNNFV